MGGPLGRPGVARAEAAAIAGMLLAALDDELDHGDHLHADGVLDRSELPIRAFDEVDAEHRADGALTHEELVEAFRRLGPATRRELGEALRPLAAAYVRSQRRLRRCYPVAAAGCSLACAAGMMQLPAVAAVAGVAGFAAVFGAGGFAIHGHRTKLAIAGLVDDAFS